MNSGLGRLARKVAGQMRVHLKLKLWFLAFGTPARISSFGPLP